MSIEVVYRRVRLIDREACASLFCAVLILGRLSDYRYSLGQNLSVKMLWG